MIKANELRIGNWVSYNNAALKVEDICAYADADTNYNGWLIGAVQIELLHPIPLTPEILEKCGFDGHRTAFYKTFSNGGCLTVLKNRAWLGGPDACTDAQAFDFEIKFFHQLQNLYFALTGTELEINL